MQSILRGLYNGHIIPWERPNQQSQKQLALLHQIEREEQYFMETMSIQDRERFEQLTNLRSELGLLEEDDLFSYGFSLGALLMLDVLKESHTLFPQ